MSTLYNNNDSNEEARSKVSNSDITVIESQVLLGGRKEIVISHGVARYRLRVTAGNKLILTK